MLINFFPCFLFHSIFKSKTNHLHVVKELRGSGFSLPFRIGTLAHDPLLKNGPYGLGRKEEKEERKEGKEERKKGRKAEKEREKEKVNPRTGAAWQAVSPSSWQRRSSTFSRKVGTFVIFTCIQLGLLGAHRFASFGI